MFSIPLVRENRYIFVPLSRHGVLQFLQLLPRNCNPCYLKSAISHQNVTNETLFRGLTYIRNFLRVFHSPLPPPPSPSHEIQTGFQLLFGNLDRHVWMKRDLFETARDEIISWDFFFFHSPISSLGSRKIETEGSKTTTSAAESVAVLSLASSENVCPSRGQRLESFRLSNEARTSSRDIIFHRGWETPATRARTRANVLAYANATGGKKKKFLLFRSFINLYRKISSWQRGQRVLFLSASRTELNATPTHHGRVFTSGLRLTARRWKAWRRHWSTPRPLTYIPLDDLPAVIEFQRGGYFPSFG